jgi:hypothetical protein
VILPPFPPGPLDPTPTPAPTPDALMILKQFVADHPALFLIGPSALDAAERVHDTVSAISGIHYVNFRQEVDGLPLIGCVPS